MSEATQKKVLMIDDDKFLLDMYAVKFKNAGWDVHVSDNGADALKVLQGGYAPDVMLVDVVMPGMDGIQFLGAVRAARLVPDAAVIMLTNQGLADDIFKAKKENIDSYIIKATTIPSDVLRETEKVLANKR